MSDIESRNMSEVMKARKARKKQNDHTYLPTREVAKSIFLLNERKEEKTVEVYPSVDKDPQRKNKRVNDFISNLYNKIVEEKQDYTILEQSILEFSAIKKQIFSKNHEIQHGTFVQAQKHEREITKFKIPFTHFFNAEEVDQIFYYYELQKEGIRFATVLDEMNKNIENYKKQFEKRIIEKIKDKAQDLISKNKQQAEKIAEEVKEDDLSSRELFYLEDFNNLDRDDLEDLDDITILKCYVNTLNQLFAEFITAIKFNPAPKNIEKSTILFENRIQEAINKVNKTGFPDRHRAWWKGHLKEIGFTLFTLGVFNFINYTLTGKFWLFSQRDSVKKMHEVANTAKQIVKRFKK